MLINLQEYKKKLNKLPAEVKEAEAEGRLEDKVKVVVRDGSIGGVESSEVATIAVRATGERTGYAFTQDLSENPMDLIRMAYENSCYMNGEKQPLHSSETGFCGAITSTPRGTSVQEINGDGITKMKELAFSIEELLHTQIPMVSNSEIIVEAVTTASHVVNSKGVDGYYESRYYTVEITAVATMGEHNYNGRSFQMVECLEELKENTIIEEVEQSLLNQFNPGEFTSGVYEAVLDKYAVCNMMITLWKVFSAKHHLEATSIFSGAYGSKIASETVTIVDQAYDEKSGYYRPFDYEGSYGNDVTLVRKGQFVGLMHNYKTAMECNEEVTGNAGRAESLIAGMPSDYTVVPRNIRICPGNRSVEELLTMMGDGVYITETYDQFHSINQTSGEFSIPCKGVIIKNGKKEMAANALTISGNIKELFQHIVEIGNDLHTEIFFTGAYAYGSPSLYVTDLQITG